MVIREICHILSRYLLFFSFTLLLPLITAIYYQFFADPLTHPQPHSSEAFFTTILMSLFISMILRFIGRRAKGELYRKEGILVVVFIWVISSVISAMPFYFSKTLTNPLDAHFEAMSGLTTTGSSMMTAKAYDPHTKQEIPIYTTNSEMPTKTYEFYGSITPVRDAQGNIILSGLDAVSRAVLLWRSFIQWIGGMGIVVIFLTVLPALGVGGRFLYQMEITGPIKEEIAPRIKETASLLWKLYLFLTLVEITLLYMTNISMSLFDAVCTTFSNISTGGFTVKDAGIAGYNSLVTETIVLVFMVLGGINFALYFHIIRFKFSRIHFPDIAIFLSIGVIGSILVSLYLIGYQPPGQEPFHISDAFRIGTFQAISMQTSTGFSLIDFDKWPFPSQMFMLILMFIGGMSGSTAGGIKTSRFYVLYKVILNRLESLYRPDSVHRLKIGSWEIQDKNAQTILGFFCIAAFLTILGTAIFILDGIDPETSLGLTACFINNTGLAFRAASPDNSLLFLSSFSKLAATLWMLLGRLEFYIILLVLLPTFWRDR